MDGDINPEDLLTPVERALLICQMPDFYLGPPKYAADRYLRAKGDEQLGSTVSQTGDIIQDIFNNVLGVMSGETSSEHADVSLEDPVTLIERNGRIRRSDGEVWFTLGVNADFDKNVTMEQTAEIIRQGKFFYDFRVEGIMYAAEAEDTAFIYNGAIFGKKREEDERRYRNYLNVFMYPKFEDRERSAYDGPFCTGKWDYFEGELAFDPQLRRSVDNLLKKYPEGAEVDPLALILSIIIAFRKIEFLE